MPVLRINRRALANLPPVPKPTIFYDDDLKGFGVRVMPSGSRAWIVEYRPGSGGRGVAKKRLTIGSTFTLSPEDARREARKLLACVELGEDPAGARAAVRKADTVRELLVVYMEKIRATKKPRTAATFNSLISRHIIPAIGNLKSVSVTRSDVVKLHRSVGAKQPVTANRAVSLLRAAFTYAEMGGMMPDDFRNPASRIDRYAEDARERYLSTTEIGRLGETLRLAETEGLPWDVDPKKQGKYAPKPDSRIVVVDPFVVAALRLLLLTGCRLREILHLRWSEVDLQRGILFLADSKTGKKSVVIGAPAMEILATLPCIGEYVIPGRSGAGGKLRSVEKPRCDLNRPWARICAHAGLEGVRVHDLRHSFASVGACSGLGLPIIGKLLGHARPETTARYAHLADDPLRRASDAISASILAALMRSAPAEIVSLKRPS